ncbi:hypothetical protein ACO0RG_004018 [Hanseniaspora osmophila]
MSGTGFSLSLKKPKKQKKKPKSVLLEKETGVSFSQTTKLTKINLKRDQGTALGDAFDKRPKKKKASVVLINEIDSSTDYLQEKSKEQSKEQLCIQPAEVLINKDQTETTLDEYQHIPKTRTGKKLATSGQTSTTFSSKKISSNSFAFSDQVFLPVVQKSRFPKAE